MLPLLTIGEVARRSGVAASALRYYEERGLIRSERAGSGHRRFPRAVLRRIAFIVFAQRLGMSLEEVKAELDKLPTDHIPTGEDWSRLSGGWTRRIDERIAFAPEHTAGEVRSPGVTAGEEPIPRRRADRGIGMRIDVAHAFTREPVDVRRRDAALGIERADVAIAEIVGIDDDDVGLVRGVAAKANLGRAAPPRPPAGAPDATMWISRPLSSSPRVGYI